MPGVNCGIAPFQEGCLTMKDYSKLNKQFIMIDMYDDSEDCEVQLLDCDENDESMDASSKKSFSDQLGRVIAAAERIMREGR